MTKYDFSKMKITEVPKNIPIETTILDLRENNITKIENLDHLINLRVLLLNNNRITKIEGLDNLINLQELNLNINKITKIEKLDYLINLKNLDLSCNYIINIEGLKNSIDLQKIKLSGNEITKIQNLQSLNSFTIQFSDNSLIEYKILSRTDYGNYFTYRIEQNTSGLQLDGIVLNYKMSASFTGSISSSSGPSALNLNLIPLSTVITDVRGFLTSSFTNWHDPIQMAGITGSFYTIINDYPNVSLDISASIIFTTTSPTYVPIMYIVKVPNFTDNQAIHTLQNGIQAPMEIVAQTLGIANNSPQTLELIKKINPIARDAFFVAFGSTMANTSVTASTFNFALTQSTSPNVGTQDLVIFNPYLTEKFEGNDYDVLYGNTDTVSPSQYYERIDYINYGINNAYFQQILSRSAIPADVKDYYYYLKRHTYPRYMGSRNSSDGLNTSSCEDVKSLQTSLKLHLGPSLQQGVASMYNTAIFEFDNGVPIFEFPMQIGKLNINQVILADNLDGVASIKPNDVGFGAILNSSIPLNNLGLQYVTSSFTYVGFNFVHLQSVTRPSSSKLIVNKYGDVNPTNEFSLFPISVVPKKSIFCIPSDFTNPAGTAMVGGNFTAEAAISGSLLIASGSIPTVTMLNDGVYVTGSLISMTVGTSSVVNTIANGLASGSRYFMSTYSDLKFPLTNGGQPITNWNWLYQTNPQDLNLSGRGIYEIVSCSISASVGILHNKGGGTFTNSKEFGTSNPFVKQGCLIWEATTVSSYILIEGSTQDLGSGNFVPADPSPFIQNNLNAIVEKFGNKPKN